jgi:hypothetical protein
MAKLQRDIGARFEREIARLLGVRRNLRADYSESAPDLETDRLVIECKYRSGIAVCRWLEQAERYAEGSGKVPVVFARERGDSRPVAVLRLQGFLELIEGEHNV